MTKYVELNAVLDAIGNQQDGTGMKVYDVYYQLGVTTVEAERVERLYTNGKPAKILFIVGDEIIAEFFCEHTVGWVDRGEA